MIVDLREYCTELNSEFALSLDEICASGQVVLVL